MKRRDFMATAAAAAASIQPALRAGASEPGLLEKRPLGKTGVMLSVIGFGGIVVKDAEQSRANHSVARAVERGVNYFDVAPTYGDAEDKLGPALEPFRKDAFLACKTHERAKADAERELDVSLKKLRTDHFDLYQLHALSTMDDLEKVFAPGGAMETLIEAKEKGKTRFLGFSAHSGEVALAAMDRYEFDTILFPFNFVLWHKANFGPDVYEKANSKNMGILALKAMAKRRWNEGEDRSGFEKCWYKPLTDPKEQVMGMRFTLSLDVTAAIPPGEESLFEAGMKLAAAFKPLAKPEESEVRELAMGVDNPIFG